MLTSLFALLLNLPFLVSGACFTWALLHGGNRLARWYQASRQYRALWLAFWLAILRYLLLAPLFLLMLKTANAGLGYVILFFLLPERGITSVLDSLFGLPPGVFPGGDMKHWIGAYALTVAVLYLFWHEFLGRINKSLSRYD